MRMFQGKRGVMLLAATFCMALGFVVDTLAYPVVSNVLHAKFDQSSAELPVILCCHDAFSGGFSNSFQPPRTPSPRRPASEFLLCALEHARASHTEYVQYTERVLHLRIDQRRSDMVYPFHDHW